MKLKEVLCCLIMLCQQKIFFSHCQSQKILKKGKWFGQQTISRSNEVISYILWLITILEGLTWKGNCSDHTCWKVRNFQVLCKCIEEVCIIALHNSVVICWCLLMRQLVLSYLGFTSLKDSWRNITFWRGFLPLERNLNLSDSV